MWSDGGYIGTVGEGTTSDVIQNYIENQGTKEEKDANKQMKIIDFQKLKLITTAEARTYSVACSGVSLRNFDYDIFLLWKSAVK